MKLRFYLDLYLKISLKLRNSIPFSISTNFSFNSRRLSRDTEQCWKESDSSPKCGPGPASSVTVTSSWLLYSDPDTGLPLLVTGVSSRAGVVSPPRVLLQCRLYLECEQDGLDAPYRGPQLYGVSRPAKPHFVWFSVWSGLQQCVQAWRPPDGPGLAALPRPAQPRQVEEGPVGAAAVPQPDPARPPLQLGVTLRQHLQQQHLVVGGVTHLSYNKHLLQISP